MPNEILTLADVEAFFQQLIAEALDFHPDIYFGQYAAIATGLPTYTAVQAMKYDTLMDACFEICKLQGADIYILAQDAYLQALKDGVVFQHATTTL